MKLFKTYEEYLETIIIMVRDFSDKSLHKIGLAINVCDSYMDDSEKIFRLNTTVMECLWEREEAIIMGFTHYLKTETKKIKSLLEYHEVNCEGDSCYICKCKKQTMNKMVNRNERKKSRICS